MNFHEPKASSDRHFYATITPDETTMNPTRYLVSAESYGTVGNDLFDGTPQAGRLPDAIVTKIVIAYSANRINSIQMHYATGDPITVGELQHYSTTTFTLTASEYVTMIEGAVYQSRIGYLTFITNKRILGTIPPAFAVPEKFDWSVADKVPSQLAHRMGLLCFTGSMSRSEIYSLAPVFADYPCEEINAKYERVSMPASHIQRNALAPARNPILLSAFALRLMSPTITLIVGPERTEYHASEDALCTLPFFKACLKGEFKEATDKAVTMPDDDPDAVACLIEFMYTGSYTYTYDSALAELRAGSAGGILDVPVSDPRQALFHLSVYTTAGKYDFAALARAAKQNLRVVTRAVDALGFLQVCEALYLDGLQISDLEETEEPVVFKAKITEWVRSLSLKYREELVKATAKYPDLACDLLDFATRAAEL